MDLTELPKPPSKSFGSDLSDYYRLFVCAWVTFCVFTFLWFATKMFHGRNKMRRDFVTIEEQLRRLQKHIDEKAAVEPDLEAIQNLYKEPVKKLCDLGFFAESDEDKAKEAQTNSDENHQQEEDKVKNDDSKDEDKKTI